MLCRDDLQPFPVAKTLASVGAYHPTVPMHMHGLSPPEMKGSPCLKLLNVRETFLFRHPHFPYLLANIILQNSRAVGKMGFRDKINA